MATALTAAVRIAVIADALTSANNSPVSPLNKRTPPWCASLPIAALPGKTQMAFSPNMGTSSLRNDGIMAMTPRTSAG